MSPKALFHNNAQISRTLLSGQSEVCACFVPARKPSHLMTVHKQHRKEENDQLFTHIIGKASLYPALAALVVHWRDVGAAGSG